MKENYIEIIATEENNSQIQDWTNEDICEAFMSGDLWDYINSCSTFSGLDNYEEVGRILEEEGFAFSKVLDAEDQEANTFKVIVPAQYKKGEKEVFIVGLIHKLFKEPQYIYDWINDIVSGDELDDWVKINNEDLPDKLYHGTSEGAIESILKKGLICKNDSRGHSNNGVGCAIFTSSDKDELDSYATGGLFEIDISAMQKDGIEIEWSQEPDVETERKINNLLYKLNVQDDFAEFYRDFEWMGVQRHLKVLGIFARLFHRDRKEGCLKDIPLVLKYAIATANRYIELKPLARILEATRPIENA